MNLKAFSCFVFYKIKRKNWFLCHTSRVPVSEPPAIEKLKVLQAMSSAIVDQSAAVLTLHFSKFIHALHVIQRFQ
jgi:hypothetical protein